MSESTEAEAKVEEPGAEAVGEVVAEVADAPVADDAPAEVVAEVQAVVPDEAPVEVVAEAEPTADVVDDEPVVEPIEEAPVPAEVVAAEMSSVRQARVFLCERGHRVTALWQTPEICQGKITRSGPVCGRPLYPMAELPEQVQKALNPLKASKKSSKKK